MNLDFSAFKTFVPEDALREAASREYPAYVCTWPIQGPRTADWCCPWGVILNHMQGIDRPHVSPGSISIRQKLVELGVGVPPAPVARINEFTTLWDKGKITDLYAAFGLDR